MKFYSLASSNWDKEEILAIKNVIKSNRYTMGGEVLKFEKKISKFYNVNHAIMFNSGSSANLIMIASLFEMGLIKKGDEVIVPAVSWSTTYFPLYQYGLKLVFVDTNKFGIIEIENVIKAISKKTRIIFNVNLLGFPSKLDVLKKIADKNKIILLEDNCESFGSVYKNKKAGTFGLMGSLSFFYSHHITTMEGGMILTNNLKISEYAKSLRAHGWLRDLPIKNKIHNKTGDNFKDSFKFVLPGYSLRPLEFSAAIGSVQLKKWNKQKKQRIDNARFFCKLLGKSSKFEIPNFDKDSTWFGFPIVFKDKIDRNKMIRVFELNGIECRPIVAGNFIKQPVINKLNYRISGKLKNADHIDECGLFLGNDHRNLKKQLNKVNELIRNEI
jgi:CDP-6-deoxy-D-xylo-4-hexulose-3-dehydrase